jgi:transcriptional regulator with XRE-family HTH domain
MSHATIKSNINRLLKERSWKVADLENKIGRGRPVHNILNGSSKNPTIEILKLIAQAFNIEIQDLLIEQDDIRSVNLPLLSDTYAKVIQEIDHLSKSITFTHNNVMLLVKETYEYSLKLKLECADVNFIKWLIQKHYN